MEQQSLFTHHPNKIPQPIVVSDSQKSQDVTNPLSFSIQGIEDLAKSKMAEHGLSAWKFKWDKAKRRLGSCQYHSKTISLSLHLFKLPQEEMLQTLLHEIAHALVGPRAGHGPRWKQKALEIGCNAQRTSKMSMMEAPTRTIGCNHCDYTLSVKRFRLPRWISRKRPCPKCRIGKTQEIS